MSEVRFGVQFRGNEIAVVGKVAEVTHSRISIDVIDTSIPNWQPTGERRQCARESVRLFDSLDDVAQIMRASQRDSVSPHARIVGNLTTR